MTEFQEKELTLAGVGMDDAKERFMGNLDMLAKYLVKFEDDPNFNDLKIAIGERNTEKAFVACHTLKGVCANLSLDSVYKPVCVQVEFLRSGDIDNAIKEMPNVEKAYTEMAQSIKRILG